MSRFNGQTVDTLIRMRVAVERVLHLHGDDPDMRVKFQGYLTELQNELTSREQPQLLVVPKMQKKRKRAG